MKIQLVIGLRLYGFCHGAFGRDFYVTGARVEAFGVDWLVVRDGDGEVWFTEHLDILCPCCIDPKTDEVPDD